MRHRDNLLSRTGFATNEFSLRKHDSAKISVYYSEPFLCKAVTHNYNNFLSY